MGTRPNLDGPVLEDGFIWPRGGVFDKRDHMDMGRNPARRVAYSCVVDRLRAFCWACWFAACIGVGSIVSWFGFGHFSVPARFLYWVLGL